MIGRSVARRYMQATFELASAGGELEATQRQLQRLQALVGAGPHLSRLLRHPRLPLPVKLQALAGLLGEAPTGPVQRLIALLIVNDRVEVLALAATVLQEIADQQAGVVRAQVHTPLPLPPEQAERLRAALAAWCRQPVELELHVDPALIGGIVVRLGDRVLDGSVRGRLERMMRHLSET